MWASVLFLVLFKPAYSLPINPNFSPDDPGASTLRSSHADVALMMAQLGVGYYFRVFETWPDSWSQVTSAGLVQIPLYGFKMESIDPDDGTWGSGGAGFNGDIAYLPPNAGEPPMLAQLSNTESMELNYYKVGKPQTYRSMLTVFSEFDEKSPELANYIGDLPRLKLFAILGISRECLRLYHQLHRTYPASWEEFLASRLAPIDANSINPVTGHRFFGDGRANDVYYEKLSNDDYRLVDVGPNGSFPSTEFTY
jgi:hypothetical protein